MADGRRNAERKPPLAPTGSSIVGNARRRDTGGVPTSATDWEEARRSEPGRPPLGGVVVALFGLALLAVLVLAVAPLREGVSDAISGDTDGLREDLRDLGVGGALIVLGLGVVHVFLWYPAEILSAAAGYVYDFHVALALVMLAWLVNGLIAYWVGRHAARPLLYRVVQRERFERLERLAERGGVPLLLAVRLVPVIPFSLFSCVLGAAHVPLGRFAWTTVVGYLPLTAIFVYLGGELEELSLSDPLLWAGAAVLIALLLLTSRLGKMISASSTEPAD